MEAEPLARAIIDSALRLGHWEPVEDYDPNVVREALSIVGDYDPDLLVAVATDALTAH